MRIWDCFLYHNEADILTLRIQELRDVVDGFVMVQGEKTFTGQNREILHVDPSRWIKPKFRQVIVERPEGLTARETEYHYRNAILRAFPEHELINEDILLISDVDEIPSRQVIEGLRARRETLANGKARLAMQFHYYFLNCLQNKVWQPWVQSIAVTWGRIRTSKPQDERMLNRVTKESCKVIEDAGWHFSFFGPAKRVWESIFSHADDEARCAETLSVDDVARIMREGKDIFNRQWLPPLCFPKRLPNLPETITKNMTFYRGLGWIRE